MAAGRIGWNDVARKLARVHLLDEAHPEAGNPTP
jgi:hypothetical protein